MKIPESWKYNIIFAILITGIPEIALSGQTKTPLKASLVTQETVGFMPNCPSKFGGTTTGTGKSTHLGKVTLTATDCVMPKGNGFAFDGTFTLTAANGDKLTGDYTGAFIPTNTGPMYRLADATFEITGGTGRFINASGSAELTGMQDIQTGEGKIEADGTISY